LADVLKSLDKDLLEITGFDEKDIEECITQGQKKGKDPLLCDITPELFEAHNYSVL
jgi:hypothetical protein